MQEQSMNTTTKTIKSAGETYQQSDYLRAIMDVEGMFEGAMTEFVLLGETAKRVREASSLEGLEKLEFGVQKRKLSKYARSTFEVTNGKQWYDKKYGKVPVTIQIIKTRYPFFENVDTVMYWGGAMKTANPFDEYWKVKDKIK